MAPGAILHAPGRQEIILGVKTVSEANNFEPWRAKHARHKVQHAYIYSSMSQRKEAILFPVVVTLTRYGPKELDRHDNLPMSLKYCVDKIAEILTGKKRGQGDNDPRITWRYDQVVSAAYGVKILFEYNPLS